jgi:Na+-transporting NADH:ubiquinone oxidoreductase subunit B
MRVVTRPAPHIRDAFNLAAALRWQLIALAPCVAMALYNTGLQANLTLERLKLEVAPGWRGDVIQALGVGLDPLSFVAAVIHGALYFLPILITVGVTGAFWSWAFATARHRPPGQGLAVLVLLFALVLPPALPLWQAALGISFGLVVGREIFGGIGKNVLNPVLVGVAFLYVTYPAQMTIESSWVMVDAFSEPTYLSLGALQRPEALAWVATPWELSFLGLVPGAFGTTSTVACILGAGVLLYTRTASARVITGVLLGMVLTSILSNNLPGDAYFSLSFHWHLTLGSFAFGAVFLATDQTTSAMTDTGRWIYGFLIGALVVLFRVANGHHPDGVMFAILMGNIAAPLIDSLVVRANIRRRARRHVD